MIPSFQKKGRGMIYSNILEKYSSDEIAKYYRLSLEDSLKKGGVRDESESIANQRSILNQFIDQRGNFGSKCREFIDDGRSGTNFDRPGWQELLDEIENGRIKVVIVKNLSRLGRSNFECGYFMDYYFPDMGIRFMTVQEGIDTDDNSNSSNEYAPLNNFMNEKYSRDLSKNVRGSKRLKQLAGEYIGGSNTPYGYIRDPKDKHHLIVEEYEASVIKLIFQWYLESHNQHEVIRKLYSNNIPKPSYKRNYKNCCTDEKNKCHWDGKTVHEILMNPVYIGSMVQHKFTKKSFRQKKLSRVPRSDWIIVPDKHEPIIDIETFNKVQDFLKINYRSSPVGEPELLQGLFVCYDCKRKMSLSKKEHIGKDGKLYRNYYTQCLYYRRNRHLNLCTLHSVNYFDIEKEVLNILDSLCKKYSKLVDFDKLTQQGKEKMQTITKIYEEKIIKIDSEIKNLDRKIEISYMDRLNDVISIDTYDKITSKLEEQKKQLQITVEELKDSYEKYKVDNSIDQLLETKKIVNSYLKTRKKLSRELIIKMVDRIEVHEDKTIDLYLRLKPLEQIV